LTGCSSKPILRRNSSAAIAQRGGVIAGEKGLNVQNRAVLVVDDDGEIRSMYVSIFEAAGLSVRCVSTRAEAIAARRRPACVVLDWELPDGSGREVAQALHRRWGAALPIILVTGASLQAEDLAAADPTRFLAKPFEPDEVLQAVRDAINRSRPRRRRLSSPPPSLTQAG
jgi:DNA-binding response OmpR family regulator